MESRRLGRSDLKIPPVMLGGNVFGWTADKAQSFRVLDAALDAGLYAIDTADMYSTWVSGHTGGESETIIGEWLAARGIRDKLLIATKVGMPMPNQGTGLSRDWIVKEVESSLVRLKTDYIDLYQSHQDDKSVPLEETMQAFAGLVKAGKVRVLGASNYDADRLQKALDVSEKLGLPRYETLQPHYNLVERKIYEDALEGAASRNGLGVIPYYALASGFLSGKYRSQADLAGKVRGAGAGAYLNDQGLAVLKVLDEMAHAHGATPTQVSLAWLAARPSITAPIVSATTVEQIADLAKAAVLKLEADEIARLDAVSASF